MPEHGVWSELAVSEARRRRGESPAALVPHALRVRLVRSPSPMTFFKLPRVPDTVSGTLHKVLDQVISTSKHNSILEHIGA